MRVIRYFIICLAIIAFSQKPAKAQGLYYGYGFIFNTFVFNSDKLSPTSKPGLTADFGYAFKLNKFQLSAGIDVHNIGFRNNVSELYAIKDSISTDGFDNYNWLSVAVPIKISYIQEVAPAFVHYSLGIAAAFNPLGYHRYSYNLKGFSYYEKHENLDVIQKESDEGVKINQIHFNVFADVELLFNNEDESKKMGLGIRYLAGFGKEKGTFYVSKENELEQVNYFTSNISVYWRVYF